MHFLPIFDFISSFEPFLCGIQYTLSYIFHGSLGNIGVFISKYIFIWKNKIKRDNADIELFLENILSIGTH